MYLGQCSTWSPVQPVLQSQATPQQRDPDSASNSLLLNLLTLSPLSLTQSLSCLSFSLGLPIPSPSGCGIQRPGGWAPPQALCCSLPSGSLPSYRPDTFISWGKCSLSHILWFRTYIWWRGSWGHLLGITRHKKNILAKFLKILSYCKHLSCFLLLWNANIHHIKQRPEKAHPASKVNICFAYSLAALPRQLLLPSSSFSRWRYLKANPRYRIISFWPNFQTLCLITFLRILPVLVSHAFSHEAFTLCWIRYCIFIWSWS